MTPLSAVSASEDEDIAAGWTGLVDVADDEDHEHYPGEFDAPG